MSLEGRMAIPTADPDDGGEGYDMLVSAEVAAAGRMGLAQGHRCCGGCCDMRRAVIIVDLAGIALCVFYAIYFAVLAAFVESDGDSGLDAATRAKFEIEFLQAEHVFVIMALIKAPLNGLGVYGALKFKSWPVLVALVAYGLEMAINLFTLNIGGLILTAFFAYPHVFFLRELKSGVMSEANYPIEKHSCCCV